MLTHSCQFSVIRMACALSVSRSGHYAWIRSPQHPSTQAMVRQDRDEKIKVAFDKGKERNGSRRIQAELEANGDKHNIKTIARSMKRQKLVAKAARKFKVTTNSDHKLPVAQNLLEQNFEAPEPNQKWAGDITYLMTSEGWLYLAVIIDLHSRAVIGWSTSTRMTADLVCDALKMAQWRRGFPRGTLVHSDRGSLYCSSAYRKIIADNGQRQSMSRKGNCWDACVESFFGSLKVEAVQYEPIMDRETMRQAVFEYIEVDYNQTRRHSALGYLSPEEFESQYVA